MKESPHRATDDFGVPEVNGSWQTHGCGRSEGGGGTHDGAHVPGILNGVENDNASGRPFSEGNGREFSLWYFSDCENALWAVGIGGGREFCRCHLLNGNTTVAEATQQLASAGKLWVCDRKRGANDERRTEKIVDGPSALGDEKTLTFSRLAALQVSRYREHAHETGTEVGTGGVP